MRVLWVDDSKQGPLDCDIARTYDEALTALRTHAYDVLYLDHDLGEARTGYNLLMQVIAEGRLPAHVECISLNPVGRARIEAALAAYRKEGPTAG